MAMDYLTAENNEVKAILGCTARTERAFCRP